MKDKNIKTVILLGLFSILNYCYGQSILPSTLPKTKSSIAYYSVKDSLQSTFAANQQNTGYISVLQQLYNDGNYIALQGVIDMAQQIPNMSQQTAEQIQGYVEKFWESYMNNPENFKHHLTPEQQKELSDLYRAYIDAAANTTEKNHFYSEWLKRIYAQFELNAMWQKSTPHVDSYTNTLYNNKQFDELIVSAFPFMILQNLISPDVGMPQSVSEALETIFKQAEYEKIVIFYDLTNQLENVSDKNIQNQIDNIFNTMNAQNFDQVVEQIKQLLNPSQ